MVTKKYVRLVILLACGLALVLASSGCKKKAEEEEKKKEDITIKTPTKKVEDIDIPPKKGPDTETLIGKAIAERAGKTFVVEPMVGIDKVRFGMTVEEMKKILGEPKQSRGVLHEYGDAGFAIFAINDAVMMITCGDRLNPNSPLVKNCTCRTRKGIGMGSSKEDVIKAYGGPPSTRQLPNNGVILRYDQLHAEFLLRDDKVSHMTFRSETFRPPPR